MAIETVAVTGGSGLIGSAIVRDLNDHGYRTANLDREPRHDRRRSALGESAADEYLEVDLLDAGEVYGGLSHVDADAVIHMGTLPTPRFHPGHVTFASNAMTSWNVLEAARALELEAACLASSINALGWGYQDAPPDIRYLPVDEEHPATPRDPYALGKLVTEVLCDGFGRLPDPPTTIATVRYPFVATDDELRERYADADRSLAALRDAWDPDGPSDDLFAYVHVEDAASITRHAIEADLGGHETFWAVAADTSADVPSETLVREFHSEVEVRRDLEGTESLISIEKARDLLGWEPAHSWRDVDG